MDEMENWIRQATKLYEAMCVSISMKDFLLS